MRYFLAGVLAVVLLCCGVSTAQPLARADGYHGIWYMNQPTKDEYVYKYSGGLGTYCMKHIPMAVYSKEANKTFFVYGGVEPGKDSLLEMVSYYDHATGMVPRPVILMDKKTNDAHDNPVIALDDAGHVWVFVSAHGTSRPSYIFRSEKPHDIDAFGQVLETNFSYPQPWHIPGKGFLFLHTRYSKGRGLFCASSPDGREWSEPQSTAHIAEGHYQVSWPCGDRVGTAFDYHPKGKGLNFRTNLYYMETADMGRTWRTVTGTPVETPLSEPQNPALVHDYEAEGLLVYVKDVNYDPAGRPAVLFVTSRGWEPGPKNGPHTWRVARWTGTEWRIAGVAVSDNNYDSGSLYIGADGTWRIIGPARPGPQAFNPGGEIVVWTSPDGDTWTHLRDVTANSEYNHSHARRPLNAHPDFAAYWADGHGRKPSDSRLYFCNLDGTRAFRLPVTMTADMEAPEPLPAP
ncbi:MAG: hypothetical protein GX580_12560 [Candidatus Hydrogenedens sp.]|nr:BNR-4 repeat-containing protein [Candidatus Hydrogenedentota bacterium]NLF58457.1 hypothetical protein [Candidatus Hydrogenedens sp.]